MSKPRAVILGITGQDGSYMAEHLLGLDYEVYGVVRRTSTGNLSRINHLMDKINIIHGDVTDSGSITRTLSLFLPNELYNFAAMSHVHVSFDEPASCFQSTAVGCLNCLEAIKHVSPDTKYLYTSSSESFGSNQDDDGYQRITTSFSPNSPYAVAKVAAFHMTKVYREAYGLKCCSSIGYNHESERRQDTFVTRKITKYVAGLFSCINKNLYPKLHLGNLAPFRDWSHAKDFVRAFHMMLQVEHPKDYVVASGNTCSVQQFLIDCFEYISKLDNHHYDWEKFVVIDPKFFRPCEVPYLRGDSAPIRQELGWSPQITYQELISEMIDSDIRQQKIKV